MTNKNNTVLYIGLTSDIEWRILAHKKKDKPKSFTARYNINKLVYFEKFNDINKAILREKQLKKWRRAWKENIINEVNPKWKDLSLNWFDERDLLIRI